MDKEQITKEQLIERVFKKYEDPELNIDVWTLGLIYEVKIDGNKIKVVLTFTSLLCPFGPQMVEDLRRMILEQGAEEAEMEVTFTPPWKPSEELREMLGV
ncbi:MAG: iron-sulfur cluster assembly protein [Nanoarchaeota archaeon]